MDGQQRERTIVAELVELVLNPQDPGYQAAAQRRGRHAGPRWYDRPLVALGCLLIGFVLVIAYVHTHRGAPEAAKVHDDLVSRVRTAQEQGDRLATTAQQLNQKLSTLRDRELANGSLSSELSREQLLAGRTAVTGPGLQVILGEPQASSPQPQPGRVGTQSLGASHILTDRDVRSVVNELWADGAEAISVNQVRLTPTSAIRFAGQVILVDLVPITSPYTVRAIGPPDALATGFAASAVASRYQTLVSAKGIEFSFGEQDTLRLPASAGTVPGVARPAPTAASTR